MGEFDFIEKIRSLCAAATLPSGVVGIGDDCAVVPYCEGGDTVVTTDMLVEGVHFLRSDATPEQVGHKAAAVNLSDIAAMGATPIGAFLSIALPKDAQGEWAERFVEGFSRTLSRYGTPLLGGDTTSSLRDVCVNVAVVGRCESGRALLRSGAQVGDTIYVTGPLGDSGAGLKVILSPDGERTAEATRLVERHYTPTPRLSEGYALAHSGEAHAMMDISDGIASDLGHILGRSAVAAEVDIALVPTSEELRHESVRRGWNIAELALAAGEDFELLVVGTERLPSVVDFPIYPIGRIVEGPAGTIKWLSQGAPTQLNLQGYRHF